MTQSKITDLPPAAPNCFVSGWGSFLSVNPDTTKLILDNTQVNLGNCYRAESVYTRQDFKPVSIPVQDKDGESLDKSTKPGSSKCLAGALFSTGGLVGHRCWKLSNFSFFSFLLAIA